MEAITRASVRPCFPSPKLGDGPDAGQWPLRRRLLPPGHGFLPSGLQLLPVGCVLVHLTYRPSPSVSWPFSGGTVPRPRSQLPDGRRQTSIMTQGWGRGLAVHPACSAHVSSVQGCKLEVLALQGPQAPLYLASYRLGHSRG